MSVTIRSVNAAAMPVAKTSKMVANSKWWRLANIIRAMSHTWRKASTPASTSLPTKLPSPGRNRTRGSPSTCQPNPGALD